MGVWREKKWSQRTVGIERSQGYQEAENKLKKKKVWEIVMPTVLGTCSWLIVTIWKSLSCVSRCSRGLRNWISCEVMVMDKEACCCTVIGSPPSKVPRRFR